MELIDYAVEIVKRLKHAGYIAYFAGGWVRDHLMHHPSSDIDIATDASPDKILDLFPHTLLVGLSFGVVIVCLGGHQFEVATFRKDFGYSDGRKPDKIEFSDPREDALRRDFTINGMFYDPIEKVIHDFIQGTEDIEKGIIRAIGNPYERFLEDRLRMIRAIRFASRFSFSIDFETQEAIVANADNLFPAVAKERVWLEFKKMSESAGFDHALVEMQRLGLLSVIFPELSGVHLNEIKHRTAHFNHFPVGTPTILFLCELFPDLSCKALIGIFQELKVSNQELKWVEAKDRFQIFLKEICDMEPAKWAHFYASSYTNQLIQLEAAKLNGDKKTIYLKNHQHMQNKLSMHIERLIDRKPLISSLHLMELGITPGVSMGILLKEAERLAINQNAHEPSEIIHQLQKNPLWKSKDQS